MIRLALFLFCICLALTAPAATFTATYTELARSPLNIATTWYSGAVTRDGKFIYGLGHSHNAYGNNSLWLYDPATEKWTSINQGEGWGNSGTLLKDGRLVLMGGGINGPADVNKSVWIGTLQ